MRLINHSAYETRTLRRIARAMYHYVRETKSLYWWPRLRLVFVSKGTRTKKFRTARGSKVLIVRLPELRGDEWVGLVRQQYGANPNRPDALHASQVAGGVVNGLWALAEGMDACDTMARNSYPASDYLPSDMPLLVPLQPPQPRPVPKDRVRARYHRVRELEKVWQRKAKLAATKIRKLKRRRLYYEKLMAKKEAG